MKELNAFSLTNAEKAHYIYIHEPHIVQVQRDLRSAALHLRLQFLQMLRLHSANQPYRRSVPIRIFLDLQSHFRSVSVPSGTHGTFSAICILLNQRPLRFESVPNFWRSLKLRLANVRHRRALIGAGLRQEKVPRNKSKATNFDRTTILGE